MKKKEILLNGEWRLIGTTDKDVPINVPINIPGYVHTALEEANIVPKMFYRDNAELCQWPEEKEWVFEKEFDIDKYDENLSAVLCFGGIDTYADIYFNNKSVYTSSNMFIPVTINVSDLISIGKNSIRVVIKPYKEMIKDKPPRYNAAFTTDRLYVRRIQCTFYWDWVNRFVSAGIWRDVKLQFMPKAYIEDVFVRTSYIAKTSAGIDIEISTENALSEKCKFVVEILAPDGQLVWKEFGKVFLETLTLHASIENPKLWWPVGYGDHPLYTVNVSLMSEEGETLDKRSLKTGIRTVAFELLKDKEGSMEEERTAVLRSRAPIYEYDHPGESFILLVNGERIFCTGGNWVPPSPFPSSTSKEEYKNLIKLAADGNMNCLRVWGGGVYEQDLFYDLCDEMGVMITEDLMLACGDYPEEDAEFMQSFGLEVEATIKRLRNHCSIVCWSGNNENGDDNSWDDPNLRDMEIQTQICLPLFAKLDPYRTYRMCNPYGGKKNSDMTIGDNHASWWWKGAENITKESFDMVGRFASESPIGGYSMPSVLNKFLTKEDYLDPNSKMVEYHIKNNPYFTEVMKWPSILGRLQKNTEVMLGFTDDPYQNLYRFCYVQYEWARLAVEGTRRSDWYGSAIQYWMYNDCWPAIGFAVVDYYGRPKAGWYATKRAAASLSSTIKSQDGKLQFICLNNSLEDAELSYKIKVYDCCEGKLSEICEGNLTSNANNSCIACVMEYAKLIKDSNSIVFFEIYRDGKMLDRSRYYANWLADLEIPAAKLNYSYNEENNCMSVKCEQGVAIGICFDGEFVAEDNFFDLIEGETKLVKLCSDTKLDSIDVYGYNVKREKIL